jgi:predicted secreted protein
MKSLHKLIALVLLVSPVCAGAAFAAESEQPRYNVVEFQAEAQREVPNDLLNATLYVELNDVSAAKLADAINKRANDALRVAKEHKGVRARSGNNQAYPVYSRNNVLQGWRGRAEIRIESKDFDAASGLIGKLQSSMQLAGMSFSVSPETRRAVQDELSVEAIKAFKTRADILRTALAGRRYKLVRLNVATGYQGPQPRFAAARVAASPEVAPPDFEAGVSLVTVVATGTIEIVD